MIEDNATPDLLRLYFREMRRVPLLDKTEERVLFQRLSETTDELALLAFRLRPVRKAFVARLKELARGERIYGDGSLPKKARAVLKRANAIQTTWFGRNAAKAGLELYKLARNRETDIRISLYDIKEWLPGNGAGNPAIKEALARTGAIKDKLVEANLRFVADLAKGFPLIDLKKADLIQEGNIGLMHAVEKFDHGRGNRFSTYARWWIRQYISRALTDQGRTIRIPAHAAEQLKTLALTSRRLLNERGREATNEELAQKLGWPLAKVEGLLDMTANVVSLHAPINRDNEEDVLGDFISNLKAPSPEDLTAKTKLEERVRYYLSRLTAREAEVIRRRFGIDKPRDETLQEIGNFYGRHRERIRQIEERGLKKLKSIMQREGGSGGRKFLENLPNP